MGSINLEVHSSRSLLSSIISSLLWNKVVSLTCSHSISPTHTGRIFLPRRIDPRYSAQIAKPSRPLRNRQHAQQWRKRRVHSRLSFSGSLDSRQFVQEIFEGLARSCVDRKIVPVVHCCFSWVFRLSSSSHFHNSWLLSTSLDIPNVAIRKRTMHLVICLLPKVVKFSPLLLPCLHPNLGFQ